MDTNKIDIESLKEELDRKNERYELSKEIYYKMIPVIFLTSIVLVILSNRVDFNINNLWNILIPACGITTIMTSCNMAINGTLNSQKSKIEDISNQLNEAKQELDLSFDKSKEIIDNNYQEKIVRIAPINRELEMHTSHQLTRTRKKI